MKTKVPRKGNAKITVNTDKPFFSLTKHEVGRRIAVYIMSADDNTLAFLMYLQDIECLEKGH